jgi:predicted ATPase/class 3 adenylate cyclase
MLDPSVEISGFGGFEQIAQADSADIVRAMRGRSLLIVPRSAGDDPGTEQRLFTHLDLGKHLALPGVVRPREIVRTDGRSVLVLEGCEGRSLSLEVGQQLELGRALALALSGARILAGLHGAGITHCAIRPDAFVVTQDGSLALVDLGSASRARRSRSGGSSLAPAASLLPWTAPEATGRINRGIDARTDLYAWGVVVFQLLAGQTPFQSDDPLELLHKHLAVPAVAPSRLRPDVPPALDRIVLKLLAKRPGDRYQTARGLVADLERVARDMASGQLAAFQPGRDDLPDTLRIPGQPLGRDAELRTLLGAVDDAGAGNPCVVVVRGPSGVGKSMLVRELQRPVMQRRGIFVQGRFEQGEAAQAQEAILVALREVVKQALAAPPDRLASLGEQLRRALGGGLAVLAEFLPDLLHLVGDVGVVSIVPPAESRHRFRLAVGAFLGVFARPARPLVLFIDDVQWADTSSLELLEWLVAAQGVPHLLLVLGARPGASPEASPESGDRNRNAGAGGDALEAALARLEAANANVRRVELEPFDEERTTRLVAEVLHRGVEETAEVARLLHERTRGNPFDICDALVALEEAGTLRFDHALARWVWSLEELRRWGIDDDVQQRLAARFAAMGPTTREVLLAAACLGSHFDLETLGAATDVSGGPLAAALGEAEAGGLVMKDGERGGWTFVHDRLQRAVLDSSPAAALPAVHARLALGMRARLGPDALERALPLLAQQITAGASVLADDGVPERIVLVEILLTAARRLRRALSFGPAAWLLRAATALLGWADARTTAQAARLELGECEAMAGRRTIANQWFGECMAHAQTDVERARICRTQVVMANLAGDHVSALEAGVRGLALVGVAIPMDPSRARVAAALAKSRWLLRRRKPEALLELGEMTAAEPRVALDILMELAGPAYSRSENLAGLVFLTMMNLALAHGNHPLCSFAYAIYGFVVGSAFGDRAAGYAFGRVGIALADRYGDARLCGRARFSVVTLQRSWVEDWRDDRGILEVARSESLGEGDFQQVSYCDTQLAIRGIIEGQRLDEVVPFARAAEAQVLVGGYEEVTLYFQAATRWADHLRGRTESRSSWSTEAESERDLEARAAKSSFTPAQGFLATCRLISHVVAGEPEAALAVAARVEKLLHALQGQILLAEFVVYRGLAAADALAAGTNVAATRRVLKDALGKVERWARDCPVNFTSRRLLLLGSAARIDGRFEEARRLLELARVRARSRGEDQIAALAAERLAAIEIASGNREAMRWWLTQAAQSYADWGASGKLAWMSSDYPELATSFRSARTVQQTSGAHAQADLTSVMKAAAALTAEIQLDRLLAKTLSVIIENSGARRGALLLERDGVLVVEVEADVESGPARRGQTLEDADGIARSVVRYVARTGETLVLEDASADARFAIDPHLAERTGCSLLCRPLTHQGQSAGILYLENDLADGAIPPARVEVVAMLSAQAAVAIANARLYDDLQRSLERQRRLTEAQARFVPTEFLEGLSRRTIVDVALGEYVRKEMSILFSDIAGFTTLIEAMQPQEHIGFINEYLSFMEPALLQNGGFVDSYIGDAILALFQGAADDALRGGIALRAALDQLNADRRSRGQPLIRMGVGVNTGMLTMGIIGGPQRLHPGVIGDPVNLAARVESMTRRFGSFMLVSHHTRDALTDPSRFALREVARVRVRGRVTPVTLYEVLDAESAATRDARLETLPHYREALDAFYDRRFAEARDALLHCVAGDQGDPPAAILRARAEALLVTGAPADWDGVETLGTK